MINNVFACTLRSGASLRRHGLESGNLQRINRGSLLRAFTNQKKTSTQNSNITYFTTSFKAQSKIVLPNLSNSCGAYCRRMQAWVFPWTSIDSHIICLCNSRASISPPDLSRKEVSKCENPPETSGNFLCCHAPTNTWSRRESPAYTCLFCFLFDCLYLRSMSWQPILFWTENCSWYDISRTNPAHHVDANLGSGNNSRLQTMKMSKHKP